MDRSVSPAGRRVAGESGVARAGLVVAAVCVLALVAGGVVWVRTHLGGLGGQTCTATAAGQSVRFAPDQMNHASTITLLGLSRGLPARAGSIALATAIQESKLRNLDYGDRDSVGLFQQRPSQGWGTEAQLQDPVYATTKFYDALVKVDGWQDMRITEIAQEVQRSAYPEAYDDHEIEGRTLASAFAGHSPGGLVCRLGEPSASGRPDTFAAALTTQGGVTASVEGRVLAVTAEDEQHAWAIGAWSVAQAQARNVVRVQVGDRVWERSARQDSWQGADETIPATQVRVTLAD